VATIVPRAVGFVELVVLGAETNLPSAESVDADGAAVGAGAAGAIFAVATVIGTDGLMVATVVAVVELVVLGPCCRDANHPTPTTSTSTSVAPVSAIAVQGVRVGERVDATDWLSIVAYTPGEVEPSRGGAIGTESRKCAGCTGIPKAKSGGATSPEGPGPIPRAVSGGNRGEGGGAETACAIGPSGMFGAPGEEMR
jgi:hypothetical protein